MANKLCECEHERHWSEEELTEHVLSDKERVKDTTHPAHKYMQEPATDRVHTVYGWYDMCAACAKHFRENHSDLLITLDN